MAAARSPTGVSRPCPHCRTVILASAAVCPKCQHHLRFDVSNGQKTQPVATAFRLEGSIQNHEVNSAREYSVVVTVHNERGELLGREVVGVGAIRPNESRNITLSVEFPAAAEPLER
jgi:hypothetical protein